MTTHTYALRAAVDTDETLLWDLFAADRVPILLSVQYAGRQASWSVHWPHAENLIVEVDEVPVGRVLINKTDQLWWVVDVAILPYRRGEGTGTRVLGDLVDQARRDGARVGLRVDRDNAGARALYERLGLRVVGQDELQYVMQTGTEETS